MVSVGQRACLLALLCWLGLAMVAAALLTGHAPTLPVAMLVAVFLPIAVATAYSYRLVHRS